MTAVMQGVRVLEVAEHTFVPAASALLADWGAEVIKIEHVERGDAMRGLMSTGVGIMGTDVHVLLEHSNRGKKSLGLDLTSDDGLAVLHKLAATCDVFLTNKLPSVREKLRIGVEEIRAANPSIIYVRGTGQGERGPDADKGSYDVLSYWHRSGMSLGTKRDDYDHVPSPPAPAFGDSIGAMTIAGGIMGALFHRERTGEATVVDVSLLGVGIWSMGAALALSLQLGMPWSPPAAGAPTRNPLVATYPAKDGHIAFSCLQAPRYWAEACSLLDRPDLATDERFAEPADLMANAPAAAELVAEAIARAHRRRVARAAGRLQRPVDRRAGHDPGLDRPPGPRQRPGRRLRHRRRHPVQAGRRARAVRRAAAPAHPRPRVQRARRRDPRRARARHGRDHRPQGPRRRRLTTHPTPSRGDPIP